MNKLTKALLGLGLLAGATAPALAADAYAPEAVVSETSFYLRGDLGWSWLGTDGDNESVAVIGGGVGYQFNDNLRTDLRGDYAGVGNDDVSFGSVLANVYFDIPTETIFTPYIGAGLGYGWAETSTGEQNGVAFAGMAGVEVNLTDNLSADVGYRYRQILSDDTVHDNEALVGLRYSF